MEVSLFFSKNVRGVLWILIQGSQDGAQNRIIKKFSVVQEILLEDLRFGQLFCPKFGSVIKKLDLGPDRVLYKSLDYYNSNLLSIEIQ